MMAYTEADSHFWHKNTEIIQKLTKSAKLAHFFQHLVQELLLPLLAFFYESYSFFWLIWISYGCF